MAKRRGMEAVASKAARKKAVFSRRKPDAPAEDAVPPMPPEGLSPPPMLTCPKCGLELADTDENRAYVDAQGVMDEAEPATEDLS